MLGLSASVVSHTVLLYRSQNWSFNLSINSNGYESLGCHLESKLRGGRQEHKCTHHISTGQTTTVLIRLTLSDLVHKDVK